MKSEERNSSRRGDRNVPSPLPGPVLALIFGLIAVALVLGYLLLNKMVEISHQEDCMLGHRGNCAASETPSTR